MNRQTKLIASIVFALAATSAGAQTAPQAASVSTEAASSAPAKPHPLRNVSPGDAFAYFSGNARSSHNHPAIYAYQGAIQKLVVVGRGYRAEYPISQSEQAFNAYRGLLKKSKYKIDDREDGKSPLMPAK